MANDFLPPSSVAGHRLLNFPGRFTLPLALLPSMVYELKCASSDWKQQVCVFILGHKGGGKTRNRRRGQNCSSVLSLGWLAVLVGVIGILIGTFLSFMKS